MHSTDELFAGNRRGVCILSAFLADSIMPEQFALRTSIAKPAFVWLYRLDGDFDLRWFTPTIEDDLCGHATLASA